MSPEDKKLCGDVWNYFRNVYQSVFGIEHPRYKPKQLSEVFNQILLFNSEYDHDLKAFRDMIDNYFEQNFDQGCDYRFSHFVSTIYYRMYDTGYY